MKEKETGDRPPTALGDRLLWRKDADPYQMKVVKARIRSRQRQRQQAKSD